MTMSERVVTCPVCGTALRGLEVWAAIVFPHDLEPVAALLEKTLNRTTCPTCLERLELLGFLTVNYPERRVAAAYCDPKLRPEYESLIKRTGVEQVEFVDDYEGLRARVRGWVAEILDSTIESITTGALSRLPRTEQIRRLAPFFIRMLKVQAATAIPLSAHGASADVDRNDLFHEVMTPLLLTLGAEAASQNLFDLEALFKTHIPRACLTDGVLAALDLYVNERPTDADHLGSAYRDEIVCGVAHAFAGRPNQRSNALAHFLVLIWRDAEERQIPPRLPLPPPELARRIVEFRHLWNRVATMLITGDDAPAQLNSALRLMRALGFEAEALEMLAAGGLRIDLSDATRVRRFLDDLLVDLRRRYPPPIGAGTVEDLDTSARMIIKTLAGARLDAAVQFGDALVTARLQDADDAGAFVTAVAVAGELVQLQAVADAERILTRAEPCIANLRKQRDFGPLLVSYAMEKGNVARHTLNNEDALDWYTEAEAQATKLAPAELGSDFGIRLAHNRAIVYRQMGRFGAALPLLQDALKQSPDDPLLHQSLAVLCLDINAWEDAAAAFTTALAGLQTADIGARVVCLSGRALARERAGDAHGAFDDLRSAWQILPVDWVVLRARLACVAIAPHAARDADRLLQDEAFNYLRSVESDAGTKRDDVLLFTVQLSMASYLHERGDHAAASTLLATITAAGSGYRLPWQVPYLGARLSLARGDLERAWSLLTDALTALNTKVPTGSDALLSPSWMRDKEAFQRDLASTAVRLVERNVIDTHALTDTYEFLNAREISARLTSRRALPPAKPNWERLARAAGRPVDVVMFVDTGTQVRVVHIEAATARARMLADVVLSQQDLERARIAMARAFRGANPADLSVLDARLAPWRQLATTLGSAIAETLTAGSHVVFLPGRTMTGMPLHLITSATGELLLKNHTISYAPNVTVLIAPVGAARPPSDGPATTIVSVSKARDTLEYRERALQAAERLRSNVMAAGTASLLIDLQATHAAVLAALTASDEVVFICHGASPGQGRGYGICVAHDGQLPPNIVPVERGPDMLDFLVCWDDIDQLEKTPEIVVSVACSSGLVDVGPGGVRFGLEQALLACSTRAIISPLWDVEQATALAWLETLFSHRRAGKTLEVAYRDACLESYERGDHLFFWGGFALTGTTFKETP